MKKLFGAAALFMISLVICSVVWNIEAAAQDFRGVWVATVANLDWPSSQDLTPAQKMAEADVLLDRAAEIGLNAVILQVRPAGDALYPSKIYPWSHYLTGTQGAAPADGFDPLRYWIDGAHSRGMELHAWINPYRVTHGGVRITNVERLAATNPARLDPSIATVHGEAVFLDPGLPQNIDLIIRGIVEIIENYNVDGIHMDDYFYPARDFNDDATFAAHGQGWTDREEWRRDNVNTLVRGIQQAIKETRPEVRFGISPVGIWRNQGSDFLGSDTNGNEGYSALFADSRRWVKEGWLDYINPQIYWHIGHNAADYATLAEWWTDVTEGTGVDLYIGIAAWREDERQTNWGNGEVLRQLQLGRYFNNIDGYVFFRAKNLIGHTGNQVKAYYDDFLESDYSSPLVGRKLTVVQPSRDFPVTGASGFYFYGSCDPSVPLYVNGWLVENVTAEGFWSVYCPLWPGEASNFTFTQEGQQTITRRITNSEPAPVGSTPPAEPARINDIGPDTPLYATVNNTAIWAFPGHRLTGGSNWLLLPGQKDKVTGRTEDGNWLRLSSGLWVEAKDVTTTTEAVLIQNMLQNGVYAHDFADLHSLSWLSTEFPVINVKYEENVLTVYFGMHSAVPSLDIANAPSLNGTIFSSVASGMDGSTPYYAFTIKPDVNLEGYWTSHSYGAFKLYLKLRKTAHEGPLPLQGFVFVVDPGHGGSSEPGALGPMGADLPEKVINMDISQMLVSELEALGAQVWITRKDDTVVSTFQRTEFSRYFLPDMFISIHCNSTAETTDATNIKGLTMWYRNELSRPAAETFMEKLHMINPGSTRSLVTNTANFYVCRPSWTPSILVEASFMNNIHDFTWLIRQENQAALARGIAEAVLEYYRQ